MTRALKETTAYVRHCIEAMNRYVDYAKEDKTHEVDWNRHWAIGRIDDEYNQAFGALQLAFIYLEEIEEEDRDKLSDRLFEERRKAENRCWEEIK